MLNGQKIVGIAEGLDVVRISANEVLVQFGSRSYPSELLRDTDLTGVLGEVFARLEEGPISIEELVAGYGAEDRVSSLALIDDLLERGILSDADASPVEQYLRYTFTGTTALAERTVSVIGAGPIGARVAQGLLQHGVGRLTLLDDRTADELWYRMQPLEMAGALSRGPANVVLKDRLRAAGHVGVEALDEPLDTTGVETAVARSDFSVLALEQPDLHLAHLVNRFCIRDRRPWLLIVIDGNLGIVGPLFLPVETACYSDYRTLVEAGMRSPEMARKHRQHILRRHRVSFFPGLPSYAEIVAGYGTLAAVHFLVRQTSFLLGRVITIDFDRMVLDVEDVLKLPRCPVCGTDKKAYQPAFSPEIVTGVTETAEQ
jgi:bacteriocin biosynthesis cyclodehydratase domain-containing protein